MRAQQNGRIVFDGKCKNKPRAYYMIDMHTARWFADNSYKIFGFFFKTQKRKKVKKKWWTDEVTKFVGEFQNWEKLF